MLLIVNRTEVCNMPAIGRQQLNMRNAGLWKKGQQDLTVRIAEREEAGSGYIDFFVAG